jgi:hypothetical protein
MSDITVLQRLWELEADLRDDEETLLNAQHELVDAQAWAAKMKRSRDEALERLQAYKKQHAL